MKLSLLALLTLVFAMEAFAQRYNPPRRRGGRVIHQSPGYRSGPVIVNPGRVGPRYNPPGSFRRLQSTRRYYTWQLSPVISCDFRNVLVINGRAVHDFYSAYDCQQAASDVRIYGDFCNGVDLYDQSGLFEGRYSSNWECREALGWFY